MNLHPVLILCPMECEADVLLSRLSDATEERIGGYTYSVGNIEGCPVVVARCLVGTTNAAVCTALAVERYAPSCAILQGTAGAHDPDLHKNDIVVGERIVGLTNIVSRPHAAGEGSHPFEWEDFGVQTYIKKRNKVEFVHAFAGDRRLVEAALSTPYTAGKLVAGTVGSGDVWNKEADLILHHHTVRGTDCEAMEGFGVAQVCASFGVPAVEIRIISNNELYENDSFAKSTAANAQTFVCDLLKRLGNML